MPKTRLAFLYNVRHQYPNPKDPRSQLETDFDDPEVIRSIISHLRACGFDVLPIEANEHAYQKLFRNRTRIDLAFNFSEGIYGADRECHIPAMLEMLQISYLGCRPLVAALILDKVKTKQILSANGVSTTPYQVFTSPKQRLSKDLRFPLIVKPRSQGSSAGITNQSIVRNRNELARQVAWVLKTFEQDALVEPFLTGREFSIALLANPKGKTPTILPFIEARHELLPAGYEKIDSLEVKWFFEEESASHHLACPPKVSRALKMSLERLCIETWNALEIRDWCRIDIRCDTQQRPYVLEVNSPAGLLPPEHSMTSYLPMAARAAGMNYRALLKRLVRTALQRVRNTPGVRRKS